MTSTRLPLQKNDDEFGHKQQVAVITKLSKQRKDVIGVFYSRVFEEETAEEIKNNLNHILSGGNSTVKTYKMGYDGRHWSDSAAAEGVTRYVLLGYPPNQREAFSRSKEAAFFNSRANQGRRITNVIVIKTKSSLVGRSLVSLEGFLQMDGDLDSTVLAENALAHFGG